MQARYHVAVRRPDDDAILSLPIGSMPGFTLDDAPWWQLVTPVVERCARDLGVDVVALRAAWLGEPDADRSLDRLYEVAWTGGDPPAGWRWVARRPGAPADAAGPGHRGWRAASRSGATCSRGTAPTWFDRDGRLDRRQRWRPPGDGRTVPSARSAPGAAPPLLRVDTDRGRLWAKQVPSVFAHEIA